MTHSQADCDGKSTAAARLLIRCVPRLTRGLLSFVSPKESSQRKGDPGSAVGCADFPALLVKPGGCATRGYAPQTVLADFSRLACVARRITGGTVRELDRQCMKLRSVLGLLLPSASSSSAGRNGKKGEHCLSPAGASCAAPVATEQRRAPGAAGRRSGRAFFLGTSSWQDKKKYLAGQRRNPACPDELTQARAPPVSATRAPAPAR